MHGLGCVVAWERLALSSVSACAFAGQEPKGPVSGMLKLAMRHWKETEREQGCVQGSLLEIGK